MRAVGISAVIGCVSAVLPAYRGTECMYVWEHGLAQRMYTSPSADDIVSALMTAISHPHPECIEEVAATYACVYGALAEEFSAALAYATVSDCAQSIFALFEGLSNASESTLRMASCEAGKLMVDAARFRKESAFLALASNISDDSAFVAAAITAFKFGNVTIGMQSLHLAPVPALPEILMAVLSHSQERTVAIAIAILRRNDKVDFVAMLSQVVTILVGTESVHALLALVYHLTDDDLEAITAMLSSEVIGFLHLIRHARDV